jgi:hypothetical protein
MLGRLLAISWSVLTLLSLVQPCLAQQSERSEPLAETALSRKRALTPVRSPGDAKAGTAVSTDANNPSQGGATSLPAPPSQNVNMTWDGDRSRPNDRRRKFSFYPRLRTALTRFDVAPFENPPMPAAFGGYGGCYLVPAGTYRNIYSYGWDTLRTEVCD